MPLFTLYILFLPDSKNCFFIYLVSYFHICICPFFVLFCSFHLLYCFCVKRRKLCNCQSIFVSFFPSRPVILAYCQKFFKRTFYHSLLRKCLTKIGAISFDTLKQVYVTNVFKMLFAMPVLYLIHGNQHSQHPKNCKNQNLLNKVECDTEYSTVQGSKDK